MPEASVGAPALIEWGVASLALPGEAESGDRHLVKPVGTSVLVAVVDGLGHGAEAASAAQAAVAALERHASESLVGLVERCHRALKGTRGAVMSVAAFSRHDRSMTWVGVGNVEGLLVYGDGTARSGAARAYSPSLPAIPSSSPPTVSGKVSPKGCPPRRRRNSSPIRSSLGTARARMMRSCSSPGTWAAPERGDDLTSSHGALGPVRSDE